MEKMSSATPALNAGAPIVVRDRHAIFDSLRRRIEKFVYDPDRGRTFDIWLKRYEGQDFTDYETLVKTKCTDAKLDTIDFDGLQCLFHVAGLQGADFAECRTRLLRKLDQSEKITLKDLTAECQFIKFHEEDSRMLEVDLSVDAVQHRKNFNRNREKFKQQQRKKYEPDAFEFRSDGKDSMQQRGPTSHSRRNRQIRRVVAALKKDDHPHLDVTINGHPIQLLLDTGAGVTIVSESKWKLLGKPLRQKIHDTGFAANGTPLKIRGCFDADFAVNNSSGGCCS
ncbi:hypothetical protein Y032_0094g2696 [Ancylostoma ceylanicum]|nr:hypothetical protein Y032_0094g2696 [Ancylostoma ceylanicum]